MKNLNQLTKKEYNKLIKADLLQVLYPEAIGDYDNDCNNGLESYEIKNELYERYGKPKYKAGGWVVADERFLCRIDEGARIYNNHVSATDIRGKKWTVHVKHLTKADNSRVQRELIEEAKRRGFIEGLEFSRIRTLDFKTELMGVGDMEGKIDDCYDYISETDALYNFGAIIYKQGKWAEIVKEEPIKVGQYDVRFTDNGINVGCKNIDKYDVYRLKSFYDMVGKLELSGVEINAGMASLSFIENNGDVNTVSYEDLCKIAEKLQD